MKQKRQKSPKFLLKSTSAIEYYLLIQLMDSDSNHFPDSKSPKNRHQSPLSRRKSIGNAQLAARGPITPRETRGATAPDSSKPRKSDRVALPSAAAHVLLLPTKRLPPSCLLTIILAALVIDISLPPSPRFNVCLTSYCRCRFSLRCVTRGDGFGGVFWKKRGRNGGREPRTFACACSEARDRFTVVVNEGCRWSDGARPLKFPLIAVFLCF